MYSVNRPESILKLVCFQNGALTLETIRDKYITNEEAIARIRKEEAAVTPDEKQISAMKWKIFREELEKAPVGNNGVIMIPQHKTEDVVRIPLPEKPFSRGLDETNRSQVFRAAVEGQAYFLKWIADEVGLDVREIKLTGGVSADPSVRRILSDVFQSKS